MKRSSPSPSLAASEQPPGTDSCEPLLGRPLGARILAQWRLAPSVWSFVVRAYFSGGRIRIASSRFKFDCEAALLRRCAPTLSAVFFETRILAAMLATSFFAAESATAGAIFSISSA